jgi:hypothetical protein
VFKIMLLKKPREHCATCKAPAAYRTVWHAMNTATVPATGPHTPRVACHAFSHISLLSQRPYYLGNPRFMEQFDDKLTLVEVPGNGSCLFHAVLVFFFAERKHRLPVYASSRKLHETSLKLRERAVDYVLRHYDRQLGEGFEKGKDLIVLEYDNCEGNSPGPPIRDPVQYRAHMRCPTTFAGNTELVALSQILRSTIIMVQDGVADQVYCFPQPDATIHIHFNPRSEHYTAFVKRKYARSDVNPSRGAPATAPH